MRRLASLVVACLLTPLLAGPVAATTSTTIYTNVTVGAGHTPPNGAWGFSDGCETGIGSNTEYACAFEFNISALPSTAKVTSAVLSIRRSGGCTTNDCPVDVASYTGNGLSDLSDVTAGSVIATWTPNSTTTHSWNVLGQIQAHVTAGEHWAGFRLSRASGNSAVQDFDIATSGTGVHLAVSYIAQPVDVQVYLAMTEVGADGKVTGPGGIDCGTSCTATFEYAEPITLTAVPLNGATSFVDWEHVTCDEGQHSLTCSFIVPSIPPQILAVFTASAPAITQAPPTPTAGPSHGATPKPSSHATSAPGAPTAAAPTQPGAIDTGAPTTGPTAEPGATTAASLDAGATPGPTVAPTQPASDQGGGSPLVIVLLIGIAAIVAGGGAYWLVRRRQGGVPPGGA